MTNRKNIEMLAKQLACAIPASEHHRMLANWAICIKGAELRLSEICWHDMTGEKPSGLEPGEWEREIAQADRLGEKHGS